jgi:hypothetical protein
MINKTVVLVKLVGDPYEPDATIAVCSTMDEALKLDLKGGLWNTGKREILPANSPENDCDWERSKFTYINLKTGEIKIIHDDFNRPSPYADVVPLNVLLVSEA